MPQFRVHAQATAANFSQAPGAMTSPELTVTGGVELSAGSIPTLAQRISGFTYTFDRSNAPAARDAYLTQLNQEPIRTYRNASDTADVTLEFRWSSSEPAGDAWTPGNGSYLYPVEVVTGGKLLAFDEPTTGGYDQISAEIVVTRLP